MSDVAGLIERLERAESGSPELDSQIALACGWTKGAMDWRMLTLWFSPTGEKTTRHCPPAFTTSLDAALSLVPDGMCWSVYSADEADRGDRRPNATIWKPGANPFADRYHYAGTAALAMCLAAMSARA